MKATEIRLMVLEQDVIGLEYLWSMETTKHHYITRNGERIAAFDTAHEAKKTLLKIKRMGLGLGWQKTSSSDEEEGIVKAGEIGESPFEFSIISR